MIKHVTIQFNEDEKETFERMLKILAELEEAYSGMARGRNIASVRKDLESILNGQPLD